MIKNPHKRTYSKNAGFMRDYRSLAGQHSANTSSQSNGVFSKVRNSFSQIFKSARSQRTSTQRQSKHAQFYSRSKSQLHNNKTDSTKDDTKTNSIHHFGLILISPFVYVLSIINDNLQSILKPKFVRVIIIQVAFVFVFGGITWKLITIQVTSNEARGNTTITSGIVTQIIPSRRGQIYIKDLSQNKSDIAITSTRGLAHVWYNPLVLKQEVARGRYTVEHAAQRVAGGLNISYPDVLSSFQKEINKEQPLQYVIIARFITEEQKAAVEFLRTPFTNSPTQFDFPFINWLGMDNVDSRLYPENSLLSTTIGFVPRHLAGRTDTINAGCESLVIRNEQRRTVNTFIPGDYSKGQYSIGYYGLEQKYCLELAGLNGRKLLNNELGTEREADAQVVNGANLFLTIDRNIQQKAEDILKASIDGNNGAKNGSVVVLEVETGKILGMASYPAYDPNDYAKADINAFRNASTNIDYEVGSVLKPITVAAVLNEWELGVTDSKGERRGLPANWQFDDYGKEGKPYPENNGNVFYISNSQFLTFGNNIGFSQILRDSINTGIAEMLPSIGNKRMLEYLTERFKFGHETAVDLPGDQHGDITPLERNVNSNFTYATYAFGQGFTASPIQLARSYSALANDGILVEPYLVEKIVTDDNRVDTGESPSSPIFRAAPTQIIKPQVAARVTGYLVDTIDQGYRGSVSSKGRVPGYTVAGKTGTSQISRSDALKEGKCLRDENVYQCNTRLGLYDHTFVGYGPASDPKYIVLIKLSEPNPGLVNNFAENTVGPYWSEMMKFTLEYMGVPKEPGR